MQPFEGKASEDFELRKLIHTLVDEIVPIGNNPAVIGLADVARGYKPSFPVTVYVVSGDDTSGIAGLLKPNGDFLQTNAPRKKATYWEFDETFGYKKLEDGRVIGDSWAEGNVTWDGSVVGSINLVGKDGDNEYPISVREWDGSLHDGDWMTTGELWKAMERGTGMQNGPRPGRIHAHGTADDGAGARYGM